MKKLQLKLGFEYKTNKQKDKTKQKDFLPTDISGSTKFPLDIVKRQQKCYYLIMRVS